MDVLLRRRCYAELTAMSAMRSHIGEEAQNYSDCSPNVIITCELPGAHFSSDEILNGVTRTSSPLCITEVYKVMDLNGNSPPALMKHEAHSQFTQRESEREGWNDKRGRDVARM